MQRVRSSSGHAPDGNSTRTHFDRFAIVGVVIFVLVSLAPSPAQAQGGFGLRAGVSADPDQFVFGAHFETAPLFDRLRFRPNAEIGVGDDVTLVALNAEFAYWLPVKSKQWGFYAGGGPAMNIYFLNANGHGPGEDDTDVEPGLNFMFGVQHRRGFFTELKIGAIDSPDFKFVVGYAWR
jgi:hypothetical protein